MLGAWPVGETGRRLLGVEVPLPAARNRQSQWNRGGRVQPEGKQRGQLGVEGKPGGVEGKNQGDLVDG